MKKSSIFTILSVFCILFVTKNVAIAQVGITAVPFLMIEPDSRTAGMGNAGVALADDASATFWNPAGLAFQSGREASITHANWLPGLGADDIFYDYLSGKTEIEGLGTIGAHITYLNLGQQERRDEANNPLGTFNSYEIALGASYATKLTKHFGIGTSLRFVYSSLTPNSTVGGQQTNAGQALSMDIAGLYKSSPFTIGGSSQAVFSAGFNLSNIGFNGVQYSDEAQKDPLPTYLRTGIGLDIDLDKNNTIRWAFDVAKIMARNNLEITETTNDEGETVTVKNTSYVSSFEAIFNSWGSYQYDTGQRIVDLSLFDQLIFSSGVEYWYNNMFAVRGGWYYENEYNGDRDYFTLGAGIRYNNYGFDFSYIIDTENEPLANTIRLSAKIKF